MTQTPPDNDQIWEALRGILDPEFAINIVDLGLIYSVACIAGEVAVTMTLTTPACPAGSGIVEGVRETLSKLPGVGQAQVDLVFEPPWNPQRLSEAARAQLGRPD